MISRLDRVSVFLSIVTNFDDLGTCFRGVFCDRNVKKWSMEKDSNKESKTKVQKTRSAAEAGASGGGGGFASQLCKEIYTSI